MINQITLVGFLGRDAQKRALPNGTPVLNFSVATKKVWKDNNNEWQERTQWHQVVCFGDRMAKLAERLLEGALVYVQGELTTRDRERTIKVPNGDAFIEHVVKQLEVEVKADVIRILDRRSSGDVYDTASETEGS
jgi:single-strand DNA-binding protein